MPRRVFVDTEWTAPPWSDQCELMWIGLADEDGGSWCAISADADIDPSSNDFISGVWKYISPDDPSMTTSEITAGVREFCGDVDEFWAWIPPLERFARFFGLGEEAPRVFAKYRDWDLQVVRSLIDPWPGSWPDRLNDLNTAAVEAGVEIPPPPANLLAPDVHAIWNRDLFALIRQAQQG
ncbi:MAG: hypothetical protein HKN80_09925 [Acidimicrobiia bacterium]|nr:hypothetical protein [Acidimicrobiia bacterium]